MKTFKEFCEGKEAFTWLNTEELVQEYVAYCADRAEEPRTDGLWRPANGERYFYLLHNSTCLSSVWNREQDDLLCYNQGNCYPTKQSAEDAAKRQRILTKLRRMAVLELGDIIVHITVDDFGEVGWEYAKDNIVGAITAPRSKIDNILNEMGDEIKWLMGAEKP